MKLVILLCPSVKIVAQDPIIYLKLVILLCPSSPIMGFATTKCGNIATTKHDLHYADAYNSVKMISPNPYNLAKVVTLDLCINTKIPQVWTYLFV